MKSECKVGFRCQVEKVCNISRNERGIERQDGVQNLSTLVHGSFTWAQLALTLSPSPPPASLSTSQARPRKSAAFALRAKSTSQSFVTISRALTPEIKTGQNTM